MREAVRRAGIDPASVDECNGNVVSAGEGQNPARQAALNGGLSERVAAMTINRSAARLKAVMSHRTASDGRHRHRVVRHESMSNMFTLLARGARMGTHAWTDIHDGLCARRAVPHMAGEHVAEQFSGPRRPGYVCGRESPEGGARACRLDHEIVAVEILQKKGAAAARSRRGDPRRHDGGGAGGIETGLQERRHGDGGQRARRQRRRAALVVMGADTYRRSASRRRAHRGTGHERALAPILVVMTPVEAVRTVAQKAKWNLADVDLFEINEAFSLQMVAVQRELGIDPARVNVNGGAVALGHPIGASGARVLTTLLYALKRRGGTRGIASLCLGGGNGVALAVETL